MVHPVHLLSAHSSLSECQWGSQCKLLSHFMWNNVLSIAHCCELVMLNLIWVFIAELKKLLKEIYISGKTMLQSMALLQDSLIKLRLFYVIVMFSQMGVQSIRKIFKKVKCDAHKIKRYLMSVRLIFEILSKIACKNKEIIKK